MLEYDARPAVRTMSGALLGSAPTGEKAHRQDFGRAVFLVVVLDLLSEPPECVRFVLHRLLQAIFAAAYELKKRAESVRDTAMTSEPGRSVRTSDVMLGLPA